MRNSSDRIRGPGGNPDLRRDIRRAVAETAAGKRPDLVRPAPWYPLAEALLRCDPGGWDKWCRLSERLRPTLRGAVETMSYEEAAWHLVDHSYGVAMLAELDDTAREMLGVYRGMVAELGAIRDRKAIRGTFLAEGGRQLIGPQRWRAIAEHPVIPTRPAPRDTLYYRLQEDGIAHAIEGLRFAGSIFAGSPRVGDLYAIAPPQKLKRKPGRPEYSYWGRIERETLAWAVKEKINPDEPGDQARVEKNMYDLIVMNALPDKTKPPVKSTIRCHAKNVLDRLARRRVPPT